MMPKNHFENKKKKKYLGEFAGSHGNFHKNDSKVKLP